MPQKVETDAPDLVEQDVAEQAAISNSRAPLDPQASLADHSGIVFAKPKDIAIAISRASIVYAGISIFGFLILVFSVLLIIHLKDLEPIEKINRIDSTIKYLCGFYISVTIAYLRYHPSRRTRSRYADYANASNDNSDT